MEELKEELKVLKSAFAEKEKESDMYRGWYHEKQKEVVILEEKIKALKVIVQSM